MAAEARVASEIEANARVVERHESNFLIRTEMHLHLRFVAWEAEAPALHVLNQKEPGLWDEIEDAYSKLRATAWGGDTASSVELRDLAKRVRGAGY